MEYTSITATVGAFFVGTLVGGGALWRYQEGKRADISLSSTLRSELGDKLAELIEKSVFYADIRDGKKSPTTDHNQPLQLKQTIAILKEDILALESKIAKIEKREPRKINVQFVRPRPIKEGGFR